jgi:hypothetical protein
LSTPPSLLLLLLLLQMLLLLLPPPPARAEDEEEKEEKEEKEDFALVGAGATSRSRSWRLGLMPAACATICRTSLTARVDGT